MPFGMEKIVASSPTLPRPAEKPDLRRIEKEPALAKNRQGKYARLWLRGQIGRRGANLNRSFGSSTRAGFSRR